MRTHDELVNKLKDYRGCEYIYYDWGYIAWQTGTGENTEIMFIEVLEPGHGHATKLVKEMLPRIKPYNSVYVFRLKRNETAGFFYRSLGFKETTVSGLYTEDAVLGVVSYKELCTSLSTK